MNFCHVCGEPTNGAQYCATCTTYYEQEWAKERERRIRNGIDPDALLVTYRQNCPLCSGECKGHTDPGERNIVLGMK